MANLVELMQRIAKNVLEADKPAALCYGVVTGLSPLTVELEQKLVLNAACLEAPDDMTFAPGDWLTLLRDRGGQRYFVLKKKMVNLCDSDA